MSAASWFDSAAILLLIASPLLGWEVGIPAAAAALAWLAAPASAPAGGGE